MGLLFDIRSISTASLGGGGGTPASGGGKLLGFVDHTTSSFPLGAQRNDWVRVAKNETVFPFTIQGVTFNSVNDTAIFTGSQWIKYSFTAETDTVEVHDSANESLSGTATLQSAVNIENKEKIEEIEERLSKMYNFIGYVSTTAPAGTAKGDLWYNSDVLPTAFPIQVKTFDGTNWSATTTPYTPSNFDTWSNKNDDKGYYWFANEWNINDANVLVDDETIELNNAGELQLKDDGVQYKHLHGDDIVTSIGQDDFFYCFSREYIEGGETKTEYIYTKSIGDTSGIAVYSIVNKVISPKGSGIISNEVLTYGGNTYNRYSAADDYYINRSNKKIINTDVALQLFKKTSDSEVFVDVTNELPATNITDQKIYRLYNDGEYKKDGQIIPPPIGYRVIDSSTLSVSSSGVIDNSGSSPATYLWIDVTDMLVNGWLIGGYIQSQVEPQVADFFRTSANSYCYRSDITYEEGYKLYYNPTKTSDGYLEIGEDSIVYTSTFEGVVGATNKLYYLDSDSTEYAKGFYRYIGGQFVSIGLTADVEVFTDEDTFLPVTDISKSTIYRLKTLKYYHGDDELPDEPAAFEVLDTTRLLVDESGVHYYETPGSEEEVVLYYWDTLTTEIVDTWIDDGYLVVVEPREADFYGLPDGTYCYKTDIRSEDVYELYHNPTQSATGYIKIGGEGGASDVDNVTVKLINGKLQSNAILDVANLPTTNIKENSIYRVIETTPIRMVKLYTYDSTQGWINHSMINISEANYNALTNEQKNDGTKYIIDSVAEALIQFTYTTIADKPKINGITLNGSLTLEDLSLYSRSQVDSMLANKGTAEFVDYIPATPVVLTWYYSTHFDDGTLVPNDNRALYICDKDGVLRYMGIVGAVDFSDYYTKEQADVLLNAKVDTAGTGLSKTGTTLNHSNSITAATTQAIYPVKIDKCGHITEYATGQAISSEYKSSAANHLFNRAGANTMWKQTTHMCGIFSRTTNQGFAQDVWTNISLNSSNDVDTTYCTLNSNGIKFNRTGIYRFDVVARLGDSIASSTFREWCLGVTGHDDDSSGGEWAATLHRHKTTTSIYAYVTSGSTVYGRIYVASGGAATLNYATIYVSCVKES